jgi:hypothetical protein
MTRLTSAGTLSELYHPVFVAWAPLLGRTPPRRTTVQNWAWERDKTHFPTPVGHRPSRTVDAYAYDVAEVLDWYLARGARYHVDRGR